MNRALIAIVLLTAPAYSQNAAPAFDVASVKSLDPTAQSRTPVDFRMKPGGRLEITNLTLLEILQEAFGVKRYQISGGPKWMDTDSFTIVARAEGDPSRQQMIAMLQSLLAQRFQLEVHRESKEGNVYALVIRRGRLKLQPSAASRTQFNFHRNDPPGLSYTWVGKKVSMARIAQELAAQLRTSVSDRTGLQGEFDFRLGPFAGDDNPDSGPALFSVLQEQLGLKLEAAKGTIETLVVGHAEKPSPN